MSNLTLFFAIIAFVASSTIAIVIHEEDGDIETRIIKGYYPEQKDVGFTAGVMLHFEEETGWCGGVLISDKYVLSSAHCLRKAPAATVVLNATNIHQFEKVVIPVVQILLHPKFKKGSYKNDIALLRLQRPVKIDDNIYPIRLPKKSEKKKSYKKSKAVVAGWGRDGTNEIIPATQLMGVNLTVISNFDCWVKYPAYIKDTNICTSSSKGTPCEGDDGGPLFINETDGLPTLIGVTSYQFSLGCTSLWPAVYTRVSYYLDWITENANIAMRE
ncbi:collagenase-like [Culicoides brevitarsis]|uniref:collagenase-like n=1 Tax=Culicoides brevitarsis TaxID=469753 RepID=UPI00307C4AB8